MIENANNNVQNTAPEQDLNEILRVRREKLKTLQDEGKNPYEITKFDFDCDSKTIKENFEEFEEKTVRLAGRIMSRRIMGKASFVGLADATGNMQLYVRRDDVGVDEYMAFKKWDIGDIIGIEGFVFKTKTGEISVHATSIKMLSKSLLPERCWRLPHPRDGMHAGCCRWR